MLGLAMRGKSRAENGRQRGVLRFRMWLAHHLVWLSKAGLGGAGFCQANRGNARVKRALRCPFPFLKEAMARALNLLRHSLHYRRECFNQGLREAGFEVVEALPDPGPGDVVLSWNRYGHGHEIARQFEARGARVLIVENGFLGKAWREQEWFSLAEGHHAGAGRWQDGGPSRWDGWGVDMAPFRQGGEETVILGQRGIGEPGVRSPDRWAESVQQQHGGRIRAHPGQGTAKPLAEDLASAKDVITWHSGAALQALLMGIPVWYGFPLWVGGRAGAPMAQIGKMEANRDDEARLAMFRRLAWAQWALDEIKTGEPIRCVLEA